MFTSKSRSLTGLIGVVGTVATIGMTAPAIATAADTGISVDEQCSVQYPNKGAFFAGQAYVLAARTAFSWRCSQAAKWPGGSVYNLNVDLQNYCDRHNAGRAIALDPGNAYSWRCRK